MRPEDISPTIEGLAADWLASEERAVTEPGEFTAELALSASERFEEAIRRASPEQMRLAWEAAKNVEARREVGSKAWADARTVSGLLRVEFLASVDRTDG